MMELMLINPSGYLRAAGRGLFFMGFQGFNEVIAGA